MSVFAQSILEVTEEYVTRIYFIPLWLRRPMSECPEALTFHYLP